jgi:uncharacterized repeat protein (TIGR04138 family)
VRFYDELARVTAQDSRYSIEAYAFVLESLNLARQRKLKERERQREQAREARARKEARREQAKEAEGKPDDSGHVNGRELCEAARRLALHHYGLMAILVLEQWGIRSTSDIGELVYNLIASGDLDKTPTDRRSDFDDVFDLAAELQPRSFLEEDQAL